jgi:hypothetical protein
MPYTKTLAMQADDLNTAVIHTQKKLIELLMAMEEYQIFTVRTKAATDALAIAEFELRVIETQLGKLEV